MARSLFVYISGSRVQLSYTRRVTRARLLTRLTAMDHEPAESPRQTSPTSSSSSSSLTTERRTLKGRPTLVLLVLIGSCYAFGYAIYRLLQGMRR